RAGIERGQRARLGSYVRRRADHRRGRSEGPGVAARLERQDELQGLGVLLRSALRHTAAARWRRDPWRAARRDSTAARQPAESAESEPESSTTADTEIVPSAE